MYISEKETEQKEPRNQIKKTSTQEQKHQKNMPMLMPMLIDAHIYGVVFLHSDVIDGWRDST